MSDEMRLVRDAGAVSWVKLDAETRAHVSALVLDTLAVAIGAQRKGHAVGAQVADTSAAAGATTIWSTGAKVPAEHAALVNGTEAEVLDFQEVLLDGRNNGHAAVVIVPALLALAEEAGGVSGAALLEAAAAALYANIRILRALGRAHRSGERGIRTTSLGAPVAAALTGARMIGLGEEGQLAAMNHAAAALPIGLLAAMAPSQGAFTQDKDVSVGLSARHAVFSVALAKAGVSAAPASLSGPRGLVATYGLETGRPLDRIPFAELDLSRYAIKPYPSNYGTQAAIRAALDIARETPAADLERVAVRVKASSARSLGNRDITGPLSARFSLPYAVASTLLRGRCTLEDFEGGALADPALHDLIGRIELQGDDALEAMNAAHGLFPVRMEATLRDGTTRAYAHDDVWDGTDAATRSGILHAKVHALLGDAAGDLVAATEALGEAPSLDRLVAAIARSD